MMICVVIIPDFNTMMVNGMQNYILRPDTNRLVSPPQKKKK